MKISNASSKLLNIFLLLNVVTQPLVAVTDVTNDDISSPSPLSHAVTDQLAGSTSDVRMTSFSSAMTSITTPDDRDTVSTAECGSTKGCFGFPVDCISLGRCEYIVTWKITQQGFVDFEMMAPSTGWVGVGLSYDRLMGNTSVIHCKLNRSSNIISIEFSYNLPSAYSNTILSGYLTELRLDYSSNVNGNMLCRFQRAVPGEGDRIFPLDDLYYLLLAYGPLNSEGSALSYHLKRTISSTFVNLTNDFVDFTTPQTTRTTLPAEGCGISVGCFQDNYGNAVTYSTAVDGLSIEFEIICNRSLGNGWCALGFSNNLLMDSTSVIDCIRNSNGKIVVQHSYNQGYSNVDVVNANAGLEVFSNCYSDGLFSCRFRRSIIVDSDERIYNLDREYYLMLASGPVSDTVLNRKLKHENSPARSTSPVDVRFSSSQTSTTAAMTSSETTTSSAGGDCGVTTGCFTDNYGSIVKFAASADGDYVQFEISCQPDDNNGFGWCAIGFSDARQMNPASVIDCIRNNDGRIIVQHSFNEAYVNKVFNDTTDSIQVSSTSFEGGFVTCRFSRKTVVTGESWIYSLNKEYYLLLGRGSVSSSGSKLQHQLIPQMSSTKVDVRETAIVETKGDCSICLIRAHGCLMITAWILLVGTSIMLARYFKTAWPGDKLCNTAIWFAAHRSMMVLALFCTAAGFIIIFVYNEGRYLKIPDTSDSYFKLHAPLGITVMILVIANPVIALLRCDPGAVKRPIFNWLHWLVGTTCHILAIITVLIGVKIGEKSAEDERISHSSIFWMLIGFVTFHCVVELVLTAHKLRADIASRSATQKKYEKEDDESSSAESKPKSTSFDLKFRYAVITSYGVVVLGLWLAMVIMIGSGTVE